MGAQIGIFEGLLGTGQSQLAKCGEALVQARKEGRELAAKLSEKQVLGGWGLLRGERDWVGLLFGWKRAERVSGCVLLLPCS